jgi:hypothetical protein
MLMRSSNTSITSTAKHNIIGQQAYDFLFQYILLTVDFNRITVMTTASVEQFFYYTERHHFF